MNLNGKKEEKKRVGVAENEFCWKVKVKTVPILSQHLSDNVTADDIKNESSIQTSKALSFFGS
jgi:hypothetical protein